MERRAERDFYELERPLVTIVSPRKTRVKQCKTYSRANRLGRIAENSCETRRTNYVQRAWIMISSVIMLHLSWVKNEARTVIRMDCLEYPKRHHRILSDDRELKASINRETSQALECYNVCKTRINRPIDYTSSSLTGRFRPSEIIS